MIFLPPLIKLASNDPKKWDEEWEDLLSRAYADRLFHTPGKPFSLEAYLVDVDWDRSFTDPHTRDLIIFSYPEHIRSLCEIQTQLIGVKFVPNLWVQFKRLWTAATPEKRGEHVLAGLAYVCSMSMNLHTTRGYCAVELCVESHRKDPRLLPKIVEEVMSKRGANDDNPDPVYISHPVRDALVAEQRISKPAEHKRLALSFALVHRSKLITFVLSHAMRTFLGLPPPKLHMAKHSTNKKTTLRSTQRTPMTPSLINGLGKARAKEYVEAERDGLKELFSKWKQYCQTCRKPNETDTKFPRCKRCWDTMQREVLYCSSACQKADWKAGHKAICGQPLKFEDVQGPGAQG
ncbi:hypothetical protein FB45DRAFT_364357 [Roridomyces roridus]|uniref:MYND-type domain-containing protein n=1 Tax=Roridomyces roridus TaxID=1738132 RepID=A0AAD7C8L3_9AGAR|nr:hypothetical protein FB45DRAFT_364357 [Roridomyces roridus]